MSMTFKSREDRVATRRRSWVHIPSVATARTRMHWSATHSCPCTPGVLGQVCVGGDTLPSEIQFLSADSNICTSGIKVGVGINLKTKKEKYIKVQRRKEESKVIPSLKKALSRVYLLLLKIHIFS